LVAIVFALWRAHGELALSCSRWFFWMVQQRCFAPLLHHPEKGCERRRRDLSESLDVVDTAIKHYLKKDCAA